MNSRSSWLPIGLVALALGASPGCKKDESAEAKADPAASGARGNAKGKLNLRSPMGAMRIDPQAMKDYRIDVCYYGTFTLRQARDSYLASLGKDEPSEKKIPNFGAGAHAAAAAGATAGPSSSAAAKPPAKVAGDASPTKPPAKVAGDGPAAKVAASASAQPSAVASAASSEHRAFDFTRAPYERNARACVAAAALKEPPMADVDAALKDFAPYAVELAKDLVQANAYYSHDEYKKDNFEKGKTLHKKLVEEFARLDDLHDKLGVAIDAWRKAHPPDLSKAEDGQKLTTSTVEDGKAAVLAIAKKPDGEAFKAASAKISADAEALKTFAQSHPNDSWGKIIITPLNAFDQVVKDAQAHVTDHDAEAFLTVVNGFVGLIEARQRAISRSSQRTQMPMMQPRQGAEVAQDPKPIDPPQTTAKPHE